MQFYKMKNKKITEASSEYDSAEQLPSWVAEAGYEITDRKIISDHLGNLVFADEIDINEDNRLKDEQALADAKQQRKNELKAERDMLAEQPIVLNGMAFDFDEKARTNIDVAIKGSAPSEKVDWTLADNKTVKISIDDLCKLYPAAKKRGNDLHISYRIASEKIDACKTIEEVRKVTLLPQAEAEKQMMEQQGLPDVSEILNN